MKYQAVITDLDGTAIDSPSQKQASPRLVAAIRAVESSGLKVCAATGRSEAWADEIFQSMGLKHPAVISGGTRIIEPVSHKELWKLSLGQEQITAVLKLLEGKPYSYLWNNYAADDYDGGGWTLKDLKTRDIYFFELVFLTKSEASEISEELQRIPGIVVTDTISQRPNVHDIHVTNREATKEHAVYELEKIINVPKEAMIGIGDGPNDFHLFEAVGYKVAMGNAVPDLKDKADQVIADVKDEGLAEFLEKLAKTGGEI